MHKLKIFIELTRLNKPIGFMLLFWPCLWGLTITYNQNQNISLYLNYIVLFFLGSVGMRSAGCIINDIVDRNLDKKVKRTKNRPLASGKISLLEAAYYSIFLCMLSFLILIQFNFLTIFLGLSSLLLAFTYPFMKRYTYWPQLYLGITFNWGIIMASTAVLNVITTESIIVYFAAIFWTLGYDTIYGVQDIVDDEIIGVKSTAIKFKSNLKLFVSLCYLVFFLMFYSYGIFLGLDKSYYIFSIFPALHLIFQISKIDIKNSKQNLGIFKSNNFFGFLIFLNLLISNY
tara:strand:+ start:1382 stop:2242 length:861 start_codon:yes stop_codon:yes gene_type:complete